MGMSFLDDAIDKYRQVATIKQDLRLNATAPMQEQGLNAVSQPQNVAAAGAQATTTPTIGAAGLLQNKTALIAGGVAVAALVLFLVMKK